MLAMTSIAVTASICASAPEAAPLVASFMAFLPRLGRDSSLRALHNRRSCFFTRNTPLRVSAAMCPHAANIDCTKLDQQCGGILTRCCCSCVSARIDAAGRRGHRAHVGGYEGHGRAARLAPTAQRAGARRRCTPPGLSLLPHKPQKIGGSGQPPPPPRRGGGVPTQTPGRVPKIN